MNLLKWIFILGALLSIAIIWIFIISPVAGALSVVSDLILIVIFGIIIKILYTDDVDVDEFHDDI